MSKEKLNEALAPIRARKVKTQAEMKKSEIDEKIITLEAETQEMCSKQDINFDEVIKNLNKIALLEREKKMFDKILRELFPDE